MSRTATLLLFLVPLASGCAQKGAFPSLKPRAVEQLGTDDPVRAAPIAAADPELDGRIEALLAQARRGEAAFEGALPATRASVRAAGGSGTESWVVAQQALSRLEAARAPTVTALADLDALAVERAARPTNAEQFEALLAAVEAAAALAETQRDEMARLRAAL